LAVEHLRDGSFLGKIAQLVQRLKVDPDTPIVSGRFAERRNSHNSIPH